MFHYLLNGVLDAPSFLQRAAEHTGITDSKELASLLSMGIDMGELELHHIGEGTAARLYVASKEANVPGKVVPRLQRDDSELRRRSTNPSGMLLTTEVSDVYRTAIDYLSSQRFSPNALILRVMNELASEGFFDPKLDQMELLMLHEFRVFGTGSYLLPMFPDFRWRIYTDSKGIASYQGGDAHRAICDFAESKPVEADHIHYALACLRDEYGVDETNYREILADPKEFVRSCSKKPFCSLRAAEAIREMLEEGKTAYILQQDQSNSGAALYSWFTGDRGLARLTNFLPSETKQDFYKAASELVRIGKLLPVGAEDPIFLSRPASKAFIVPMIYGAANASLTRGLILKDPQKDRITFTDEAGVYIPGSLESVPADRLNQKFAPVLEGMGWAEAVRVASDVARAYETAVYGSKECSGLTTELRPCMVEIKRASRLASARNEVLQWTSPSGLKVYNRKLTTKVGEDGAESEMINVTIGGVRHRISWLPIVEASSDAAAPPNVIHSVDASVVHFTSVTCCEERISLAPIHDSFGTHVCDALRVKHIVRESIIRIPQSFLNEQIFVPNGVKPVHHRGLPIEEFRKAEHFLG